ncbi:MAG: capsular biosynthesis protein [Gammaproteobacteria bacterium]|nr:capsular biosynthesis protein [Gammaproteobacteria bacterium]
MIDLHCHLLPGIDDGPRTMAESVELARMAVRNGITHAVVTPHIHAGRWNNDRAGIERLTREFRQQLAQAGVPLQLGSAAEVRLDAEILPWVEQDRLPFLGAYDGKRVLLLELPHSHIPLGAENLIAWLLQRNILPLIAHPERNKDVIRKPDKIRPLIEQGCLLQLTSGAIAGHFGKPAQQCAHQLLELEAVFVIASDAHNSGARPPDLVCGRDAASAIVGAERAQKMVSTNPMQLVAGQFSYKNS